MRCLTTTLAVEIVKPTPSNAANETVVELRYMTLSTNIERTISTEAIMISRAAALMPQCCRSITLVIPLATTPSTVAGKTYATRANQRAIPELKGIIISYLPVKNSIALVKKFGCSSASRGRVSALMLVVKFSVRGRRPTLAIGSRRRSARRPFARLPRLEYRSGGCSRLRCGRARLI
jgi:hypothetical protein